MERKHLKRILSMLQKVPKSNRKSTRKQYINSCSNNEIHAICGACRNLLTNNIRLSNAKKKYLRKRLNPIKNDIRTLSKPNISLQKKRAILNREQTGKGVFSLLASVIIPSIVAALAGK